MTIQSLALIGRTYPSEDFEALSQATKAARRARRFGAWDAGVRTRPVWRGSGEPIVLRSGAERTAPRRLLVAPPF